MFNEFVKEARRLFSSRSNGGKQVPTWTNKLHLQKQVLIALSIVLLIGHSQFRDHFKCQQAEGLDEKLLTNFCLINGTTTVLNRDGSNNRFLPHVGHDFVINPSDYTVVNHVYIRSLWLILILLVICSFFAQRSWAGLFQNEVLKAVLQLTGSDESRIAKAAEQAQLYDVLTKLAEPNLKYPDLQPPFAPDAVKFSNLAASERLAQKIELIELHVNAYDHKLDYHVNQLIYLLLTRSAAAYKMSSLNLRRSLIMNALQSTLLTVMQFMIPLFFIGNGYALYGWRWACAVVTHLFRLASGHPDVNDTTIDYEISSALFPISTSCQYRQFSVMGPVESVNVQCTVAINEICGKLFAVIWWFTVVNMLVEFYSLAWLVLTSFSARTISRCYGLHYWPTARKEANIVARFRYRRSQLDAELADLRSQLEMVTNNGDQPASQNLVLSVQFVTQSPSHQQLRQQQNRQLQQQQQQKQQQKQRQEHKRAEAGDLETGLGHKLKKWYQRQSKRRVVKLYDERHRDVNIYYLFYLLHLRLGKSRNRTEEVIKMTANALSTYVSELELGLEELRDQLNERENGSSSVDT